MKKQKQTVFILTALPTSENCWSLQVWCSVQHNKQVTSWGIFILQVNRASANQNSPPAASLVNARKTILKAKTDVAADEICIVSQWLKYQPVWSFNQTHRQAYTGKVRGIYRPPLMLQSDQWVPLISAPFLPLCQTHVCTSKVKAPMAEENRSHLRTERPYVWLFAYYGLNIFK